MKFNTIIKRSIAVSSIALIATACKPSTIEDDPALFAIASSQIRGLAAGNCAISINHAGLTYGTAIQLAINLSSGLSLVGREGFNQANYESASGSTLADQGIASLGDVPYNQKYDAFFKTNDTWTNAKRTAAIQFGFNAAAGFAPVAINNGLNATSLTQFGALSTDIQNDANAALGAICASVLTGASAAAAIPSVCVASACGNVPNFANAAGANTGACFTAASGALGGSTATVLTAIGNQITSTLAPAGLTSAVNGTGALACARIPKQNCSPNSLLTGNRAGDIQSARSAVNALLANQSCPIVSDQHRRQIVEAGVKGLNPGTVVSTISGNFTVPSLPAGTNAAKTGIPSDTKILAETAYPKFGALVSLGFGSLMPINRNNSAYALSNEGFSFGKNIDVKLVSSCDALGLTKGATVDMPENLRKDLTPTAEIAYSFSPGGTAASLYAQVSEDNSNVGDPESCNANYRDTYEIPLAIGGGKLPVLKGAKSGDGGATQLLSLCVYGGNAQKRGAPRALLAAGLNTAAKLPPNTLQSSNIPECGSGSLEAFRGAQQGAATLFSEVGNISEGDSFPNTANPSN